jgi:AcrR family transcriptional regulator
MTTASRDVKVTRTYNSSRRRLQAETRRARILAAAEHLFLRDGYAATTVAALAAAADVSPETVFKTFGGKAGLVRAIQQAALGGTDPVPAPDRSDAMSAREHDPNVIIRSWASLSEEVAPRVSPIALLVRAAAANHPEMAELLDAIQAQRLERMAHNAGRLFRVGGLRTDVTLEHARDVLFTYTSPELYETLVLTLDWSLTAYSAFIYRGIRAQLLP